MNGLAIDDAVKVTMKQLGFPLFRSTKDRDRDRAKAIALWGNKVNLHEFAIHHRFDGLVGLIPREPHASISHFGYFWRLSH